MADQEEILDLVNEKDEIIGTIPRSLADSDAKYIHREVAILIYDDQNRLLIQQRSHNKKSFPLAWIISVAGHVPAGIKPLQVAHNELIEELGFDTDLQFIRKDFDHLPNQTMFSYVYKGKFPEGTEINFDTNEIEQLIKDGAVVEPGSLQVFRDFWAGKL